jgi:hypothetical protein
LTAHPLVHHRIERTIFQPNPSNDSGVLNASIVVHPQTHNKHNCSSYYFALPYSPQWAFGTNDFTIELWANFAASKGSPASLSSDAASGNMTAMPQSYAKRFDPNDAKDAAEAADALPAPACQWNSR